MKHIRLWPLHAIILSLIDGEQYGDIAKPYLPRGIFLWRFHCTHLHQGLAVSSDSLECSVVFLETSAINALVAERFYVGVEITHASQNTLSRTQYNTKQLHTRSQQPLNRAFEWTQAKRKRW